MTIRVLSEQLASQIAAGEVVERPASVVKELVENAIDAGATTVNVDIRDGGRTLIQIADNGIGINADEVETAFLRHATSKLISAESLNTISTLGFRGEALAAIASVSLVTVVTRSQDGNSGTRLVLEGGNIISRDVVGAPRGTVIAIENLFFNTPARLKFLKSVTSEKRAIDEFLTRFALAYPHVRFRLTHNRRVTFQSNGSGNLRDALVAVYGVEMAKEFLEIESERHRDTETQNDIPASPSLRITVSGFVSPPSLHRSNRSHISLFVNGRWIKDQKLTYAIIQAYHTLLPVGRYPLAVVFVEMPFDEVDVNVHPMKTEVRFRQPRTVFGAVQRAVRSTIIATTPVRSVGGGFEQFEPRSFQPSAYSRKQEWGQGAFDLGRGEAVPPVQTSAEMGQVAHQPEMGLGGKKLPIMRVVGQIGAAYIITEGPEGMFLIDQHAAHERILYEQFLAAWGQDGVPSQQLVTGVPVQLTPAQASLLDADLGVLQRIGFTIEPFGMNTFMVRSVPALLAKSNPEQALRQVVEELEREATPMQAKIEEVVIKRVCKTAAVKAGQTLSAQEMDAMIRQLEACESPHTCPHGRPTLIHLSVAQLAKQFGRT